jgi:DNA gyrase subunit B
MSKTLQKNYQENIDNYKNEIKQLTRLVDIVRQMPGMYIGDVGLKGLINMIREIFQNSGDQLMREDSPCDHIIVSFDEATCTIIIEDNGFGIPFGIMVKLFSEQHVSSNYEKTPFKFTSGRHGIGSKVTNMLSKFFVVQSFSSKDKIGHEVRFEEGVCVEDEHEIENPEGKQGTVVTFSPSEFIWEAGRKNGIEEHLSSEELLAFIQSLVPQLNIGAKVIFNAIRPDGSQIHEVLVNEDGIFTHIYAATQNSLIEPIHIFDNTDGEHKAEIIFTFDPTSNISPYIISFANTCPVSNDSKHVIGFENGLVGWFRKYMNNVYLKNSKSKTQIIANDIKEGLICAMSVFVLEPTFDGQSKNSLANADMIKYMQDLVYNGLEEWSKQKPSDLNKVCKYLKEVADLRTKHEQGKVKLSNNFKSSSITGMPKKYTKPSGKKNLELWIVEGDSANGHAKVARNKELQGTFPIRGKMPNALTTERSKFLSNQEVSSIITIVSNGDDRNYGRNFDLNKCIWDKIIIGADADEDGKHIANLILIFFMTYMTPLVIDGRLYKSVPPLFGINFGTVQKPNFKYFTNRLEYSEYVQKEFAKNHKLSTTTGVQLTDNEALALIYKNIMYTYEMDLVCKRYALDPILLETVLSNIYEPFEVMKQRVEDKFRFMKVNRKGNMYEITGLVNKVYQLLILNDKLIEDAKHIIDLIHNVNNNNLHYSVDGQIVSMYTLMCIYKSSEPKGLVRYKGLGEMNEDQLQESTMDPYGNRTLIQYTFEDAKKEIDRIHWINNNKDQLLSKINVSRYELLG